MVKLITDFQYMFAQPVTAIICPVRRYSLKRVFFRFPKTVTLVEDLDSVYPGHVAAEFEATCKRYSGVNIVILTNNPLVINGMKPENVLLTRYGINEQIEAIRLCDTVNFAERIRTYQPGELWLSYCGEHDDHELWGNE